MIFRQMAVLILLGALAPPVLAGGEVPFKGALEGTGTPTFLPGPPPMVSVAVTGQGQATRLGRFTYEFPHLVNPAVIPTTLVGVYTFTAANGDTLIAEGSGYTTPLMPGFFLVTEVMTITGGTGRFLNATGEFTATRFVNQINGTITGVFEGTISSPPF